MVKKKQCSPKLPMMMYVCYLCGREYGSKSIAIHEKRCLVIMEKQGKITKKIKRPPLEEAKSLQERNVMALAAFEKSMMVRCPGCQRTFHGEDKLAKHMKGCEDAKKKERRKKERERNLRRQKSTTTTTPTNQSVSSSSSSQKKKRRPLGPSVSEAILDIAKNPEDIQSCDENSPTNNSPSRRNLMCYLCGRTEFDTQSIADHEAQCLEAKRRHVKNSFAKNNIAPRPPFGNAKTVKERNAMARRAFESMQKPRCLGCGRTFNGEDKLAKHMKGCEEVKQLQRCRPIPSRLERSSSSRSSTSSLVRSALKRRLSSQEQLHDRQFTLTSSASLPLMRTPEATSSSKEESENTKGDSSSSSSSNSSNKKGSSSSRKNKLRLMTPSSFRSPLEKMESFKVLQEQISVAQKTFETSLAMVVKDYECMGCQRAFDAEEKLNKHQRGCKEYIQQVEDAAKYGVRDCIVPKKFDTSNTEKRNQVKRSKKEENIDKNKKPTTVIPNPNEAAMMDIFFASPRRQEEAESRYNSEDSKEMRRSKSFTPLTQPTNLERKNSAQKKFETMEQCPGCKRTFNTKIKLLKHMKGCKEKKQQQTSKNESSGVRKDESSYNLPKWLNNNDNEDKNEYDDIAFYCQPVTPTKDHDPNCDFHNLKIFQKASLLPPKSYLCYICGQQYGSKSIEIHEKKCLELFRQRQQHEKRPKEVIMPSALPPAGDPSTRVKRNAMIMELQQQAHVFEQCGGCHQTVEQKIFGL